MELHMHFITVAALLVLLCGGVMSTATPASRPAPTGPPNAKTTEDIVEAFRPYKGFGDIQSVLFNRHRHRIFAIWCCPGSGSGYCLIWAYYFDFGKEEWVQFIDSFVDGGGDLSPEMPSNDEIIFRSGGGAIVIEKHVSNLPSEPQ
jgi:hypothetical protein